MKLIKINKPKPRLYTFTLDESDIFLAVLLRWQHFKASIWKLADGGVLFCGSFNSWEVGIVPIFPENQNIFSDREDSSIYFQ